MNFTIVSGSQRHPQNSQSLRIAHYFKKELEGKSYCDEVNLLSMSDKPYPLWDEGIWDGDEAWQTILSPISERLMASDAFVIIAPEYHGMAPSALKNFLMMCNRGELSHKPGLLVGVSSGDGGTYPVAELRMNSSKNNKICYIPEHIIVRNAETVLHDDAGKNNEDADRYFRDRIDFALEILKEYAVALKQVRESGVTFNMEFKNGM
jgi:NAD(P)H-dependent FMN reductase